MVEPEAGDALRGPEVEDAEEVFAEAERGCAGQPRGLMVEEESDIAPGAAVGIGGTGGWTGRVGACVEGGGQPLERVGAAVEIGTLVGGEPAPEGHGGGSL